MNTAPIQVDNELIQNSCKSLADALRLSLKASGRPLGEVAWDCGWRDGGKALERVLVDGHIPSERIVPFMVACKNAVPLRWLAINLLVEGMEKNAERMPKEVLALRAILTEVKEEVQAMQEMKVSGTSFSLGGPVGIPEWLICEAESVQRTMAGDC